MISWLTSKIGIYAISGLLISALAGSGWLYVRHLRLQNEYLKITISELQQGIADRDATIEFYKKAAKIDKETSQLKKDIDQAVRSGDLGRIDQLYRVFSDKARKAGGGPGADTGNGAVKPGRD